MLADPMAGISRQTADMLTTMSDGRLAAGEPDEVLELRDGLLISLAGLVFTVEHAPGHTRGSVMFRREETVEDPTVLFSGDVLFEGSIGRTDLPGGDHAQMLNSLKTKVLPLSDTTVVLPGHGGATTIGRERQSNPYLTALANEESPVNRAKGL
jgi:glyoxylase-like metal-dependent hydrolase (beta-lactamase superfamily II)